MRSISLASRPAPISSSGGLTSRFPASEFQSLPGHALVLLAGIPQEKRGMERGDEHAAAIGMQAPAELADGLARFEQRLAGHAAERQHDLRLEDAELGVEERRAGGQ